MASQAITQKQEQKIAPSQAHTLESKEYHAKSSANAGLNLNLVGAVSGIFSSKSKKETAPDGSSVEHRDDAGTMRGEGAGNPQAAGAAEAKEHAREMRQAIKESNA